LEGLEIEESFGSGKSLAKLLLTIVKRQGLMIFRVYSGKMTYFKVCSYGALSTRAASFYAGQAPLRPDWTDVVKASRLSYPRENRIDRPGWIL
jgi:hypothetical protein